MKKEKSNNGYYYVKVDGEWTIAKKSNEDWFMFGNEVEVDSSYFDEIGKKIRMPKE